MVYFFYLFFDMGRLYIGETILLWRKCLYYKI